MNILNLEQSNKFIIKLLENDKSFFISRVGVGPETIVPCYFKIYNKIDNLPSSLLNKLDNNNGIYTKNDDNKKNNNIIEFCKLYINAVNESTCLAAWDKLMLQEQEILRNKNCAQLIFSILEPFYCCLENINPWSHKLLGKKVLIVNPFVESFKKQLNNNFQIFKDPNKKIFLDGQEFVFYKSYVTTAGNHLHSSWIETFDIMCNDISKLDFDIALLGCGGYGLPLSNYIHKKLNKSVIYVGGGLQLLFGVMGKRWEDNDMWKKIIRENDTKFIRPSGDEILKNKERVEGGCFW